MASARIGPAVLLLIASLFAASLCALVTAGVVAAPGQTTGSQERNQNVDYLGPDAAARLDLDFPVLVPSYVPGPFGGEPAVSAGDGSYSLYWMNLGGPPTFLEVTGTVGGGLPAGSPADLNNQLTINATVQGHDAIHDVTAVYDAVWWISGGVLYKVESLNMETDSLSLANSLVPFIAPETSEPEPETPVEQLPPEAGGGILEPPTDAPEIPEEPVATDPVADEGAAEPSSPTEQEQAVQDDAVEPEEGAVEPVAVAATQPVAIQSQDEVTEDTGAESTVAGQPLPTEVPELEPAADEPEPVTTTADTVGSDGTGGAPLPVFGGDGTGGTRDLTIPIPAD